MHLAMLEAIQVPMYQKSGNDAYTFCTALNEYCCRLAILKLLQLRTFYYSEKCAASWSIIKKMRPSAFLEAVSPRPGAAYHLPKVMRSTF